MKKPKDAEQPEKSDEQTNAMDALSEGLPIDPLPTEGLPTLPQLEVEEKPTPKSKQSDGMEKALEIMDEYEKGVPPRNPHVQNYEE